MRSDLGREACCLCGSLAQKSHADARCAGILHCARENASMSEGVHVHGSIQQVVLTILSKQSEPMTGI